MSNANSPRGRFTASAGVAAVLLLALGLALRVGGLGREGLWLDEIYGASYTNLSLFQTAVACLRFDIHPPLYYLQLTAWSWFGHGDVWLILNSVLWSMVTLVLVLYVTLRRFDTAAALFALGLCAVMGSEVYFGSELRMYSLFTLLMVLSWIAADRLRADYRLKAGVPLVVVLIAIGAVHSFGMIAVSAVLLYVLPTGDRQQIRSRLPTWFALAALVGITLVPWLLNAAVRKVGHLEPVTSSVVSYTISGWILGYRVAAVPEWVRLAVTLALVCCLTAALLLVSKMRRTLACYVLWPMGFAVLVSVVWKPIWLARSFAFCAPFVAIAIGTLLSSLIARQRTPAARGACVAFTTVVLLGISLVTFRELSAPWKTQYRETAAYLRERVRAGDLVYMPEQYTFWGVTRYLVGPQWGSLLEVQDPVNQDKSAIWPKVYQRLGPARLELLHLKPLTRRVDGFAAPLFIGWSPLPEASTAKTVWIAASDEFRLADVSLCPYDHVETADFVQLRVYRLTCANGR